VVLIFVCEAARIRQSILGYSEKEGLKVDSASVEFIQSIKMKSAVWITVCVVFAVLLCQALAEESEKTPPYTSTYEEYGGDYKPTQYDDPKDDYKPTTYDDPKDDYKPTKYDEYKPTKYDEYKPTKYGDDYKPTKYDDYKPTEYDDYKPTEYDDYHGDYKPTKYDDYHGEYKPTDYDDKSGGYFDFYKDQYQPKCYYKKSTCCPEKYVCGKYCHKKESYSYYKCKKVGYKSVPYECGYDSHYGKDPYSPYEKDPYSYDYARRDVKADEVSKDGKPAAEMTTDGLKIKTASKEESIDHKKYPEDYDHGKDYDYDKDYGYGKKTCYKQEPYYYEAECSKPSYKYECEPKYCWTHKCQPWIKEEFEHDGGYKPDYDHSYGKPSPYGSY